MPLNPDFAGRSYPPSAPYAVGREKIREFAAAIGDTNPAYTDVEAARGLGYPDIIAPPTFATVLALRAATQAVEDPELGLDWSRVVHGEERYAYVRPLHAGDTVTVTTTIESVRSIAGTDLVTIRGDVATTDGQHVLTARSVLVARPSEPAQPHQPPASAAATAGR